MAIVSRWITDVQESAHQLEMITKDARNMDIFEWLEKHINTINDIINIMNIGKVLELVYTVVSSTHHILASYRL